MVARAAYLEIGGTRSKSEFGVKFFDLTFLLFSTRVIALPVLNFVLEKGSCTNVDDESVIACADFTDNKGKACHRYDGSTWSAIGSTLDNHHFGGMARFNNKALIMGGTQDPNGSTEEYNLDSDHWSRKAKSPLLQKISAFSVVGFEDRVYLFGEYFQTADL